MRENQKKREKEKREKRRGKKRERLHNERASALAAFVMLSPIDPFT